MDRPVTRAIAFVRARARLALTLGVLLLGFAGLGCGASYTAQASGNWSTTTTWSPNGTPGAGDTVSIGAFTVTLTGATSIDGVTFTGAGDITGSTLTLTNAATVTVNGGVTATIDSVVAGSAGLALSGGGTLQVTAANSYTGTTLVSAGTLRIAGASGSINGSTQIQVESGATLDIDATSTSTDRLADTGTLTMRGGTFSWETNATRSETIATMAFTKGHSFVSFSATTGSPTLTATGGVSRANFATMEFIRGPSPYGFLLWTGTSTGLLRWAVVDQGGFVQTANYDATNGVTQLGTGTQYTEANSAAWNSTSPYAFTPSSIPGAGDHALFNQNFKVHDNGAYSITSIYANAGAGTSTGTDQGGSLAINGNVYQRNVGRVKLGGLSLSFGANEAVYISTGTSNGEITHWGDIRAITASSLTFSGTSASELNSNLDGLAAVNGGGTSTAFTGDVHVAGGTLRAGANAALGSGAGRTYVHDGATLVIGNSGNDGYRTASGVTYTTAQPLTISGVGVASAGALANAYGDGSFAGAITLAANASLGAASASTFTLSGAIGGGFAATKVGTGVLLLSGTNTWTGATTISDGTLRVSGGAAIPDASGVTIANLATASFDLNGSSETIASLAGGGASGGNVTLGAGTLTLGGSATTTYDGVISGSGGLTVSGSGALTLTRASSYTGTTTIGSGTLYVNANDSTSAVSLASTGLIGGTGRVGAITASGGCNGGTVEPGTASARGTLIASSANLSLGTSPTVKVRVAAFTTAGTDYDRLDLATAAGALTLGGSSKLVIDLTGVTGAGIASGVITCGSRSGTFASVATVGAPGAAVTVIYNAGSVDVLVDTAATTTWLGTTSAAWGTSANWGNGIPDIAHVARYVSTYSNPCTVGTGATVLGVSILSGYASTVTQGAGFPVSCGASGFVMASASATWTCNDTLSTPTFTQSAGTFNGSGTLTMFGRSGGTLSAVSALNNLTIEGYDSGLAAYWKLDETSGTSAYDASGGTSTGTYASGSAHGASAPTAPAFADAESATFNGSSDYVAITSSATLNPTVLTISAWINPSAVGGGTQHDFVSKWGTASQQSYNLKLDGSGYLIGDVSTTGANDSFTPAAGTILSAGTWYHVALTYDGATLTTYINGARNTSASLSGTIFASTENLSIGRMDPALAAGRYFAGNIDDVRIFNRALSAAEVWSLSSGLGGDHAQAATFTCGSAITVNGTLKVVCGTLADGGNTISVKGSCTCYAPVTGTGTLALTGTGAGKTLRCGESRFPNLTVNSSDTTGVWTLQDRLSVAGTLTLAAGQLDASASNWAIHCGTLNQTGAATTLVPRSGTIVVDAATGGSVTATTTLNALRVESPSETGLVGYWKFDAQSGLTARDWSGNGDTATLTGTAMHTTTVPATPLFDNGGSLSLDGTSGYADAGTGASLALTGAVTICAWVRPGATGVDHKILSRQDNVAGGYKLGIFTNNLVEFEVRDASNTQTGNRGVAGGTTLAAATWYHVAGVYSRSGGYLATYVNGVLDRALATGAVLAAPAGAPVRIGADPVAGFIFTGLIDDVRIYNRALSASEIRNLANGRYVNGANGTGTYTLGGSLSLASFAIDAGAFNANGFANTVTNLFTLQDGQGTYTAGSATQTFNGGLTVSGSTFTGGSGTVAVNGSFAQAATTNANGGVPQSGGTVTAPSGTMTVTGSITMGGGTFTPNGGTVQLTGSGTGNTIAGITKSGGLYASFFNVDQRLVTDPDWRTSYTVTGTRVDTTVSQGTASSTWGSTSEQAAYAIGGSSTEWDNFSVQWDGWITVQTDGTTIKTRSDDSSRVWIDLAGTGVVDNGEWGSNGWGGSQGAITRIVAPNVAKGTYRIRVQYEQGNGPCPMQLAWTDPTNSPVTTADGDHVVPSVCLTPARGGGLTFNNLQVTGTGSWTINDPLVASGTITCQAGTLAQANGAAIKAAAWSQTGGTFTGSSAGTINDNITLSGALACTGGTFTSTTGSLNVGGNFSVTGAGTFAHNGGTLELRPSGTTTLTCAQTLNHVRVNDSLVAYWNFDESASPASDLTGRGHDAAWQNAPTPSTTTLPTLDVTNVRAIPLNGTSQYLVPMRQQDFILSPISVAAWVFMPSAAGTPGGDSVFDRQALSRSQLSLETNASGGYNLVINGASANTGGLTANAWHQITGTYDGATALIYADGYRQASASIAGPVTDYLYATVAIGRNEWNQGNFYPGSVDEIRIYNRALTAGEAQRLGNLHDPGSAVNTVQLGSTLTVAGDVILLSGGLDASPGYDLTVSGNWTNRGGVFTPGTRTVTLNSGSAVTIRSGNQPFNNLTLSGAGTFTAVDQLRTTGNLLQSAGTFVAPSTRLVCGGNLTVSGGTFTANGGTVIMKSTAGATLTCAQAFNHLVISDGLIAHWRFEETASPCVDVSGWNHNATWMVAPTSDNVVKPGLFCDNTRSLTFDGANTYLQVTDGFEFQPASKLSVACWVYTNASSGVDEGGIFGRMGDITIGTTAVSRGYQLMTTANTPITQLMMRVNDTPGALDWGNLNTPTGAIASGAWHHVAFTLDGTNWRWYVDGSNVASANNGANTIVNPVDGIVWIGRNATYRGGYHPSYNGKLDDLRFYDRDLSAGDVARLASGREPQTSAATFTLASNLTVNGNLTIGSGTLDLNTRAVSVAGNWRCEGVATGTTATVTLSGTGVNNTILSGGQSLPNVAIGGTGTWTCSDWFRTAGSFTQSGATFAGNARPVTVGGSIAVSAGALVAPATEVLACGGGVTDAGGATFQGNSGVLELTATANQSLNVACNCNQLWIASGANSGMVARFRLDEAQAGSAIDDVSGVIAQATNTPTASTSTPFMWTSDPYCLDFSGATSGSNNDYLTVANTTALDNLQNSSYSLSAWFYPRAIPPGTGSANDAYYGIVIKAGKHSGLFMNNAGGFHMGHWLTGGVDAEAITGNSYPANAWYHLCGVVDVPGGTTKLYVNGAIAATTTWAGGTATYAYGATPWTIGIAGPGAAVWMWPANGLIDDVRFYNRALSAREALALASNGFDAANGSATFTLAHAASVAGDLDLLGGTLSAAGLGISASQSWRNLVGTSGFTAGGDTVTLNGANQQLYGSTTFAGLTKQVAAAATLTFPVYECQTVTGTLTLNGASGQLLSIRSSIPGSMATINPTGSRACSYLDVKDSRNFSMPIINPANSTNSGDTRWWFGPSSGNGVLIAMPPVE